MDDTVAAWWDYRRLFTGSKQTRQELTLGRPEHAVRAEAAVRAVVDGGGEPALALIVALVDAAPEPDDVIDVGVGPLEDLLHDDGDAVVDEIERLCRTSPPFRRAVANVFLEEGHVRPETEARLRPLVSGVGVEA